MEGSTGRVLFQRATMDTDAFTVVLRRIAVPAKKLVSTSYSGDKRGILSFECPLDFGVVIVLIPRTVSIPLSLHPIVKNVIYRKEITLALFAAHASTTEIHLDSGVYFPEVHRLIANLRELTAFMNAFSPTHMLRPVAVAAAKCKASSNVGDSVRIFRFERRHDFAVVVMVLPSSHSTAIIPNMIHG